MENKVTGLVDKVEGAITPLTATISFTQPSVNAYQSGGVKGVIDFHMASWENWHPPTIEGVSNLIERELGGQIIMGVVGKGFEYAGEIVGISAVKRLGGVLQKSSAGYMTGSIAKMLIYPTMYNPGQGSGVAVPSGSGARVPTRPARDNPQAKSNPGDGSGRFGFQ